MLFEGVAAFWHSKRWKSASNRETTLSNRILRVTEWIARSFSGGPRSANPSWKGRAADHTQAGTCPYTAKASARWSPLRTILLCDRIFRKSPDTQVGNVSAGDRCDVSTRGSLKDSNRNTRWFGPLRPYSTLSPGLVPRRFPSFRWNDRLPLAGYRGIRHREVLARPEVHYARNYPLLTVSGARKHTALFIVCIPPGKRPRRRSPTSASASLRSHAPGPTSAVRKT